MRRRGVALITTLAVGSILVILAAALLGLFFTDYRAQRRQQNSLQAYWNARSAIESYRATHTLPFDGHFKLSQGDCLVERHNQDLHFKGRYLGATREIVLVGGKVTGWSELP